MAEVALAKKNMLGLLIPRLVRPPERVPPCIPNYEHPVNGSKKRPAVISSGIKAAPGAAARIAFSASAAKIKWSTTATAATPAPSTTRAPTNSFGSLVKSKTPPGPNLPCTRFDNSRKPRSEVLRTPGIATSQGFAAHQSSQLSGYCGSSISSACFVSSNG
jgi:hypothetical protein